jgi:hypothetical protein
VDVMALQTKKRLGFLQEIVDRSAMRVMAGVAAFDDGCMFELERSLFIRMTGKAQIVCVRDRPDVSEPTMHIVTIATLHLAVTNRMS